MKREGLKKVCCAALITAMLASVGCYGAGAAQIDPEALIGVEEQPQTETNANALPERYSSVELGYVTSIKTQQYSTCWAFASLAAMESLLLRNGIASDDLSANHLNMWATERSNGKGWTRDIYSDAYPVTALGYLTSWQGGVYQSDLGDYPLDEDITGDAVPVNLARYGVTAVKYLNKNNPEEIKRAIMDNGGAFTSYANAGQCWSDNRLSYYLPPSFDGGYAGHSIEVVGWDDNYSRDNFDGMVGAKPENNGAWLIKNSWGNNNALGGYFWMSYEDAYVFSTKYKPSYTLCGFEEIDETKKLIQNEIYGATYEFDYIDSDNLTFMNRLHFDSNYNVIDKVVFKTDAVGANYSIYYVPDGADSTPDPDTAAWTKLYDGTVDYIGYICADINDFAYSDADGTIAITIDNSAADGKSTIGVGEWLSNSGTMVFFNESERGESYIMQDGAIQDLMDWYLENNDDEMGGTFTIKAITQKVSLVTLLGDVNLDGHVDIRDVTEIQRHCAEFSQLSGTAAANADYNQDGTITIDDCTRIQHAIAEFNT